MTSQTPPPPPPPEQPPAPRRLTRSAHDRMLGGVCGGLGDYLHADPTVIRVLAVVGLIVLFPAVGIAYLVMWAVIPEAPRTWS